jgi:ssDNA-binding replication factor A large subunit
MHPRRPSRNHPRTNDKNTVRGRPAVGLRARVIDKSEVRTVLSRDGLPLVVCSATLSDGTGQIQLPLWNRQIDSVAKNDMLIIREATVRHFRGEMHLSIPRKTGSISIIHSTDGITR